MIYVDHASTTPTRKEVRKAMNTRIFANPSSKHKLGVEAKNLIEEQKDKIRTILNAKESDKIIFTGSGTESCNLAIFGVAHASHKNHIITTSIEHPAVLEACKHLEKEGYKVTYLEVDKSGLINIKELKAAITEKTALISIMYANNEIGVIQNIRAIARSKKTALFHTDACQASLLDLNVKGIDLLTLNGSKMYGPKGIGMLYVKSGAQLEPQLLGGSQEYGLRAGTENISSILGFTKALTLIQKEKKKETRRLRSLQQKLEKRLLKIPMVELNGHKIKRTPNVVNLLIRGIEAETLLHYLSEAGIYASAGSACKENEEEPSHVLKAIGRTDLEARSSIRFSLGKLNSRDDISKISSQMKRFIQILRQI